MTDTTETEPRRRRGRKIGMRLCVALVFAASVVLLVATAIIGTRLSAPDWARDRLTAQINDQLEGVSLHFGDMAVVFDREFMPRLSLRDVMLRDETGLPIANLSDIQSQVGLRPLLRGEVQPSYIKLDGAQLIVRREDTGAVGLSVGQTETPVEEASSLRALIAQMEAMLLRPGFSELTLIDVENVSLRYDDLRAGRSWSVDGGRLTFTREASDLRLRGDFVLLGSRDYATTLEMNYASKIGETAAELGLNFQDMPSRDIAGQSPALAWLSALDAPISGALRVGMEDDGALGPLNATLQIGAGVLKPNDATKPIAFDAARSYFTYDPANQEIVFSELSVDSKWLKTSAEARARLLGVERGLPREIVLQVALDTINANPADLYAEPLTLGPARMDMRLELDPFVATIGELSLSDQDINVVVSGEAQASKDGWTVAVDGNVDQIGGVKIMELWPKTLEVNARDWISENVRKASLSNIQLALRSLPKHKPDVFLSFDFEDLDTQYVKKVPIIQGAAGHATLYDNQFVFSAQAGFIEPPQGGRIDISGTTFEIPDVSVKRTPAQVHLHTKSTLTGALSLLDEEPFRFMQKAGRPVTLADAHLELSGMLNFRMVPKLTTKDVTFDVSGILQDVRSELIVPYRVLSARRLDLDITQDVLKLRGPGLIGQVPFEAEFEALLAQEENGKATVRGTVELSERFTDEFRITLPPGSVSGAGDAKVEMDFENNRPGAFRLSSDLTGVGLNLPQIDWALPRAAKGELTVNGRLGEPPVIDQVVLDAPGLNARGTVTLLPSGQLNRASFTRVRAGSWLDAPVELVGRGGGNVPPAVRVLGGKIDLRETSLTGGGESGDNAASQRRRVGPISLVLDQLVISEGISLTNFQSDLSMTNGPDGKFTGRLNGKAPIEGRIVPQNGRSAFRIQSPDAAAVFGSAGLIKQARNGVLDLTLLPGQAAGTYEGRLRVTDGLRIKDAPTMAALLNAISVVGILEQMGGEGIHFEEVDARFQLSPDRITLYSGSATGASMGISMDGYYFPENGRVDMQGVISPIYVVNGVGGLFTRRGEGLIGFNYKVRGNKENPQVSVNPLSVFTPAMFRDLFRRSPPERPEPPATQAAPALEPGVAVQEVEREADREEPRVFGIEQNGGR